MSEQTINKLQFHTVKAVWAWHKSAVIWMPLLYGTQSVLGRSVLRVRTNVVPPHWLQMTAVGDRLRVDDVQVIKCPMGLGTRLVVDLVSNTGQLEPVRYCEPLLMLLV